MGAYEPAPFERIPHPRVQGARVLVPEVVHAPVVRPSDQPWAESRVLNRLRAATGSAVSTFELIDAMVGGDPSGGCRTAHNGLLHTLWRLRSKGYPVEQVRYGFYRYKWSEWEVTP